MGSGGCSPLEHADRSHGVAMVVCRSQDDRAVLSCESPGQDYVCRQEEQTTRQDVTSVVRYLDLAQEG